MAELTPVAVDFTVSGSTIQAIHVAAVERLRALVRDNPAVDSVSFTFGALKPLDELTDGTNRIIDTVWTAEVAATIAYDEDKVITDVAVKA